MLSLDYRALEKYSRLLYVATVIGLALVWVLGLRAGGSQRWLWLGGFSFQPSEFAKIVVIVSLARYLSEREEPEWGSFGSWLGLCLCGPPTLLVLLQPDLGSALVFVGILFGMLASQGLTSVIWRASWQLVCWGPSSWCCLLDAAIIPC